MPETAEDKLDALAGRVGKVRRWLVTLAILKVAALCLVFASAYIGVYAWLDHRFNFGEVGRVAALVILLAGIGLLLHQLTRLLLRHVSCSGAANYIENRSSLSQQLVTAMEYYENKQEYPYSRALAEHLVIRVEKDCREFDFDSTVEKWKGYVLGAIILFGLAIAWFYIHDNYLYFSSYFARLTRPVAAVAPLPNTRLEAITEDIAAEPDSEVTFAAEIEGRAPETGKLVLVKLEPDATEDAQAAEPEEMQVRPTIEESRAPRFEATKSFSETGRFKYRFETESATTDWHELNICPAPEIENMTAKVAIPKNPTRGEWVKPYAEQIDDQSLEVIQRSDVSLSVQATDKLREVAITGLDGKTFTKQLNGAKEFTYHFNADRKGTIKFDLVNEQGLANKDLPDLDVVVKTDEPPEFKLICPDGDYLTTDVASVPIRFEITDDFGLDSAKMCIEIPGYQPEELAIGIEKGARSAEYSHTIELEQYDLSVGDSILFHAEATDVDTGSIQANRTSSSEVYFIEIRPYRQNWRPKPGGGPSPGGMPPPVELLNILEHTRAIVKKTWAAAGKPHPTDQDRLTLDSIDNDARYCAEQLAIIRDDSEYGFTAGHKVVLNAILQRYEQLSRHLAEYDANSAILPAKDAYHLLRKFIIELELQREPPSSGQSPQPQQPDSVKMQERPEFSQYEKERIEAEIEKAQQELKKLTREQKDLKGAFENFLKQQARQTNAAQESANGESSTESPEKQSQGSQGGGQPGESSAAQQSEGSSGGQAGSSKQDSADNENSSESQGAGEGKSPPDSENSGDEQDSGKGQGASGSKSGEQGESAEDNPATDGQQNDAGSQGSEGKQDSGQGQGTSGSEGGEQSENAEGSPGADGQQNGSGSQGSGDKQGSGKGQGASESNGGEEDKSADGSPGAGDNQGDSGSQEGRSGADSPGTKDGQDSAGGQGGSQSEGSQGSRNSSGNSQPGDQQSGNAGGRRTAAEAEAMLRMLQAKQRALQEQVALLKRDLQQLPQASEGKQGREEAQEHLDEAIAKMDDFQEKLAEAHYRADMSRTDSERALELMESTRREMDLAAEALDGELTLSEEEKLAREAQKMAEQLAEDADTFDESVTPEQEKDMLARLEAARRLLEMMPEPQWATAGQSKGAGSAAAPVLTSGAKLAPAEAARHLARQFWSISIDARKRRQKLSEDEPSDVKFYGQENEFFENAAKFDTESVQK